MGYLRNCYVAYCRPYIGGPVAEIEWYFTDSDAPRYPHGHCWEPDRYTRGRQVIRDICGEIPGRKQRFVQGVNPGVTAELVPCGTVADFRGEGTVPRFPNGQLDFSRWCACAYRCTLGIGVTASFKPHNRGELKMEAEIHADFYFVREAELLLEGEWNDLSTIGLHDRGELLLEAEWNATFTRDGDWIHSESGGMTWTEFTPLDVQWSAETSANCGGTNGNRQQGSAHRTLTLAEDTDVKFTLTGHVERQNNGYDLGELLVDGAFVADIGGTNEGLECTMGDVTATAGVTLSAGDHEIEWDADTVDENYHVGAFWRLTIELGVGVEVAELLLEAEWNELEVTAEDITAELLLEAEWNETDPPEGAWAGELLLEAEWDEIT